MSYTMYLYNTWMGTTDFQWPMSAMLKCLYLTKPSFTRLFHYRLCHSLAPGQYISWRNHTPCSSFLLEKQTGFHIVKKFPAFYGTRRFITTFTSAHHLSLSSASSIQSIPAHPTSWRSILYYPPIYALFSLAVSFPKVSPPKPCIRFSSLKKSWTSFYNNDAVGDDGIMQVH